MSRLTTCGTVEAVRYFEADDDLPRYYGGFSPSGHNVGMGIELAFPTGQGLSATWVNPRDVDGMGFAGHLAVVDLPMDDAIPDHDDDRYDVSDWPEWQPYLGDRVTHLEHIWDVVAPFRNAVRLRLENQPPVTVALGGTDETGGVTYQIDEIIVFHDDRAARVYLDHLDRRELHASAEEMTSNRAKRPHSI